MVLRAAEEEWDVVTATPRGRGTPDSYLASAAGRSLALRVASLGLIFICHLLLTRLLGAHAYGLYAYALAWMKALSVPATLGLERLVVREVAIYNARSDWASWHGLLIWAGRALLIAAIGIALVAVALSLLISGSAEGLQPFWLAMALLPMLTLLRLKQFVMQGMHRAILGQIPETLVQPLLLTILIPVYFAFVGRLTATGAMGLNVAATLAALVCGVALFGRTLPTSVKESAPNAQARVWRRSMVPLLLVSGVTAVSGQIPVLMLGAIGNAEAAGILSVAKRLADLTIIPILALSAVLTPRLAALWAMRDIRGLQRTMTKCARWVTLVSLPLALVFIIFGRPVLEIFGVPFVAGTTALTLLCVGQIVNMFAGSNGLLLVMAGHEREVAVITVAGALLNLMLCALLVPGWGISGGAVSVTASLTAWNLLLMWRVWRVLGIRSSIFARLIDERQEAN
jgi:O-antigen/teichoic acid export membrane protein